MTRAMHGDGDDGQENAIVRRGFRRRGRQSVLVRCRSSQPRGRDEGTSYRTSDLAKGSPLRRAYVIRSRTSLRVRGRYPGPPQQLLWKRTLACSSTDSVRQAAVSRRRGAAKAEPTWISGCAQRGQTRCLPLS